MQWGHAQDEPAFDEDGPAPAAVYHWNAITLLERMDDLPQQWQWTWVYFAQEWCRDWDEPNDSADLQKAAAE